MKKKITYLVGSIEDSPDMGASWRDQITPFLKSLHINVLDPVKLESKKLKNKKLNRLPKFVTTVFGTKKRIKKWHDLKSSANKRDINRFNNYMSIVITKDLEYVKRSDFIIAYWGIPSFGSAGELTVAFDLGIPVYMVAPIELPAWTRSCCTKVFLTFDELKNFLKKKHQ